MSLYEFISTDVIHNVLIGYLDSRTMFEIYKMEFDPVLLDWVSQRTFRRFGKNIRRIRNHDIGRYAELKDQKQSLKIIENKSRKHWISIHEYDPTIEGYKWLLQQVGNIPKKERLIVTAEWKSHYKQYDLYYLIFRYNTVANSSASLQCSTLFTEEEKKAYAEKKALNDAENEKRHQAALKQAEIFEAQAKSRRRERVEKNVEIIQKHQHEMNDDLRGMVDKCIAQNRMFTLHVDKGVITIKIYPLSEFSCQAS